MKNKPLAAYFVILVLLSMGFVLGAKMLGEQGAFLAQGYMLTPALAAVLTRLFFYKPRFRDANLRFGRASDYLRVWLWGLAITAGSYLAYTMLGAIEWDLSGGAFMDRLTGQYGMSASSMLDSLPPGFTLQTMLLLFTLGNLTIFNIMPGLISGFGEEFGHRGMMLPLLYRIKPWIGLIGGGLIWFLWHLPLLLIMPSGNELGPGVFAVKMIIGAIGSVCTFVYLAFIYARSGSIFVTSIAHIAMNNASAALSYYIRVENQMLADLGLMMTMIVVLVILYRSGGLAEIRSFMQLQEDVSG